MKAPVSISKDQANENLNLLERSLVFLQKIELANIFLQKFVVFVLLIFVIIRASVSCGQNKRLETNLGTKT